MKVVHVVGARPNYMKIAPIWIEMAKNPVDFHQLLVHTGQHYDKNLSDVFFEELGLPQPDYFLGIGSGSHAQQTARTMMAFETVVEKERPDLVVVVGDVNSTLACSLVSAKLNIPVCHVEAGLRSFDRTMPEELNRLLTDQLSDLLLTPSPDANDNLKREDVAADKIFWVGNVMIDCLVRFLPQAEARWENLKDMFSSPRYILVTLHRPSNVDHPATFQSILAALRILSADIDIVFPVHPRTRNQLPTELSNDNLGRLKLIDPLGYIDFLALESHAALVITDSGGVQEETTFLHVPCLTVRQNTERPITITQGTNRLVSADTQTLVTTARSALYDSTLTSHFQTVPDLWDGNTALRIVDCIRKWSNRRPLLET